MNSKPLSTPTILITYQPIRIEQVIQAVMNRNHGANLTFMGTTREFTKGKKTQKLEYEAYEPMAMAEMQAIAEAARQNWGAELAMAHRLGVVPVGEASVVIAASAPHRDACYQASRYAIEQLKLKVPIWKKEIWEDGSEWKGHQTGPWNPLV